MSDQPGHERPGDSVPHQEELEEIIEELAGALRIETVQLTHEDFVSASVPGEASAPVYELKPGEHLLQVLGRVTEVFDDSTIDVFRLYDAVDSGGNQVGFTNGNFGPDVPSFSTPDGLVTLNGDGVGGNNWSSIDAPYTPNEVGVMLYLINQFAGDGSTGMLTLWLYIGTP